MYGFLGCFLFATPLALSMAEIASPFTSAGGPYYWAAAMSGRLKRIPPFVAGWVMLIGFLGGITSSAIVTMEQVTHTDGAFGGSHALTHVVHSQAIAMNMMYTYGYQGTTVNSPQHVSITVTQNAQFGIAVFVLVICYLCTSIPMR